MSALKAVTPPPAAIRAPARPMDPSRMVQRAWDCFRLPCLQDLVRLAIAEVHLSPRPLPAPGSPGEHLVSEHDPVAEALRACCDELRDASGMAGAEDDLERCRGAIRQYIQHEPGGWSEAFMDALTAYRRVAAQSLESAFARTAS